MRTLEERIGQRIAVQRKALGFSQMQLAERIEVQPETICRIENGRRATSLQTLARIAAALELRLYEVFFMLDAKGPKDREIERILWFASRLSADEIGLFLDVGSAAIASTRRARFPPAHAGQIRLD